jgi:hypothetical protein
MAAASTAITSCASAPERPKEPVTIVAVNQSPQEFSARRVTLEGQVAKELGQVDIWTSVVHAIHMFGPPRCLHCLRLDLGRWTGEEIKGGKYRLTGVINTPADVPPSPGIACPSKVILAVEGAERLPDF